MTLLERLAPGALFRAAPDSTLVWTIGRRIVLALALATAVAVPIVFGFRTIAILQRTEFFFEDFERAVYTPPEPQDRDIVVVAIQDSTMEQFPYSSPIDRGFLADLITWLAAQSPKAIGVDIWFDQPTEPQKDAALHAVLTNLKVPLVVSSIDDPDRVTPERLAFLNDFVPETARALANLGEDNFDTARYILPGMAGPDGEFIEHFPRAIAEKLGKSLPAGRLEIAWHGHPPGDDNDAFRIYPAEAVRHLKPALFRDKVVLIGSDFSLIDRHRTPFAAYYEGAKGQLPGIVIQAHAISQLLQGRPSDRVPLRTDLAIAFVLALLGVLIGRLERNFLYVALFDLIAVTAFIAGSFELFHQQRMLVGLFAPILSLGVASWLSDNLGSQEARRQRQFIQSAFSQYVPATVVKKLIQTPELLSLRGERRELTIIFTDVAGFTTLSEQLGSDRLGPLLNRYLDGLCTVLFEFQGTMLKFMGDGTMAIFGAPIDQPNHAELAVRSCLAIDRFSENFRAEQRQEGVEFGVTRIGIHTGDAEVGNFGTYSRKEYGVMGDSINTSSRLEGANKFFGTRMCLSGATAAGCPPDIKLRPLAEVVLKGKKIAIPVFEPVDCVPLDPVFVERYADAYRAMAAKEPAALALFEAVERDFPGDYTVGLHIARLRRGEIGAVMVMTEK